MNRRASGTRSPSPGSCLVSFCLDCFRLCLPSTGPAAWARTREGAPSGSWPCRPGVEHSEEPDVVVGNLRESPAAVGAKSTLW